MRRFLTGMLTVSALVAGTTTADAWTDANANRIDDVIESVNAGGFPAAFEDGDVTKRLLIGVENLLPLRYAIYVGYDHRPTLLDQSALLAQGVTMAWPFASIDVIESRATFSQVQAIAGLAGVTRVEAIRVMYATNHYGARTVRSRDSRGVSAADDYALFPSVQQELGFDGNGVVIAILDTGVNDEVDQLNAGYPGHESLKGKFLGGGEFFSGQPALNTPLTASMNPQDHGAEASSYHATHVAGSAMGTGGPGGFFAGVAPGARLVDCKVLSDAGASVGGAERGLDWCIANRNKLWDGQLPGSIWQGIDVINMSLGSPTSNDNGASTTAQLVNTAVDAGIVVCIATGNDSRGIGAAGSTTEAGMATPASADKCIAVGASSTSRSVSRADDQVTNFSNEGPRLSDNDGDPSDEMKPSIVAPGAGILSASGDFLSDGTTYQQLSGTSMACPHAAGCAAVMLQANPLLTPLQVRTIMQNTAEHFIPSVKGPFRTYAGATDPNYDPGSGWGLIDLYAACKEAMNSVSGVQVVQIRPIARPQDGAIDVTWVTQREYPFLGFNVYRAPDANGAPGAFAKINGLMVPPAGDAVIQNDDNRTPYVYVDSDPALTLGQTYWYRVEWVDLLTVAHPEPAAPATFGFQPFVATVFYSIAHNAPDNDLFVRVGTESHYMPGDLYESDFEVLGESEVQADSAVVLLSLPAPATPANTVPATFGSVDRFWSINFTQADNIGGYLPPSFQHPWFLHVTEGGYVNRQGRVTSFSMFVNDSPGSPGGTIYATNHALMPQPTIEGGAVPVVLWIPEEAPVPVTFGRFEAAATPDGVRIVLEMTEDSDAASARIFRALSPEFESRISLNDYPVTITGNRFEYLDTSAAAGVTNYYWVEILDRQGQSFMAGPVSALSTPGTVRTFAAPVAPNPVRNAAVFRYTIGADVAASGSVPVSMTLHDVQGRLIRTLKSGDAVAGTHEVTWDGRDASGRSVAGGVYYYMFRAGHVTTTSKVTVVD